VLGWVNAAHPCWMAQVSCGPGFMCFLAVTIVAIVVMLLLRYDVVVA